MVAEHLHYAHPIVVSCMFYLINLMLIHRVVPDAFGEGLIIPLLKDNNLDSSVCDNYRALTLSPVLSKLFEYALLKKVSNFLITSHLQFGFKAEIGTLDAICVLKNVIQYFTTR